MSAAIFDDLAGQLEAVLDGGLRRSYVDALVQSSMTMGDALGQLRLAMRTHTWKGDGQRVVMVKAVQACDLLTQEEGFHALHDWDGIADHVNPEIIPVDVLDFVKRIRGEHRPDSVSLGILVDYYFFHVLSLLALRAWDTDDPDTALGRVGALTDLLQGEGGSDQPFVADPETLLLLATSHFEPDERGYVTLLDRVRALSTERQLAVALGHAACTGSHLRFGFQATYGRDTEAMRKDNFADYPWLHFAADVVLREYERGGGAQMAEALLNSLTADTSWLLESNPFNKRLRGLFELLLPIFEDLEPDPELGKDAYSPLSFFFNFSHNVLKGTIIDALLRGDAWTVSFNDLLTGPSAGKSAPGSREALALTLMGYARRHPHRIRGQLMPVIVYDPVAGRVAHQRTMACLRTALAL
ncbi:MAG TPA: hypothetical protein VMZ90_12400 [Vicinamibacterales bacterium]|nr:hypothetical protein [Vicinamibacterales bacterium]